MNYDFLSVYELNSFLNMNKILYLYKVVKAKKQVFTKVGFAANAVVKVVTKRKILTVIKANQRETYQHAISK